MTALIVALIAAVGIGGGVAIANSGGSHHGSSSPAAVETVSSDLVAKLEAQQAKLEALLPDYTDTPSALLDTEQYQVTMGTDEYLMEQLQQAGAVPASGFRRRQMLRAADVVDGDEASFYDLKGRDFLEDGRLVDEDEWEEGQGNHKMVDLRSGKGEDGKMRIGVGFWHEDTNTDEISYYLTSADLENNGATAYQTYRHSEESPIGWWNGYDGVVNHQTTAIHLGGASLANIAGFDRGLTVSDFGRWEESNWREKDGTWLDGDNSYQTFVMFDNAYAYLGNRTDQVAMEGHAIAEEVRGYEEGPSHPRALLSGNIHFDLDLAANTLSGYVYGMPDAAYNINHLTGTINGSMVKIDGTAWADTFVVPQAGEMRGGMGKLLVGKDGLEMVGNMGPQVLVPTEEYIANHPEKSLRDLYEHGAVDYTFGAKEVR